MELVQMRTAYILILLTIFISMFSGAFAANWWDPNWQYKEALTLRTTQMSLSADVTQDHVILADINSTNTNFWTNVNRPSSYDMNQYVWKSTGLNLDANLISYFKLDEPSGTNATDSKGGLTGTTSGATVNQPGKINKGYTFAGSTNVVALQNSASYKTNNFTVNAWIKVSGDGIVVSLGDQQVANWTGYQLYVDSGKMTGTIFTGSGSTQTGQVTGTKTVTDSVWHMVTYAYNGSNTYIYVDGNLDKAATANSTNPGWNATIYPGIGNRYNSSTWNYGITGTIDEVALFNKGLSAAEVLALYNSYIGGNDIRFVNKDNNVKLNWHYEDINFDVNRLIAWVGVTETFSKTTDYNINMYYGNTNVTTDANGFLTYPSTYVSVYHLTTANDAKGTNNGTVSGATSTSSGKIASAYSFDGSNDYIEAANKSNFDFLTALGNGNLSMIAWIKKSGLGIQSVDAPYGKWTNTGTGCTAGQGCGIRLDIRANGDTFQASYTNNANYRYASTGNTDVLNNNWRMITVSQTGGYTGFTYYLDVTNKTLTPTTGGTPTNITNTAGFVIGSTPYDSTPLPFAGLIDEVKVLNYGVSADEIKLLFNDENQNDVYLLKGPQEVYTVVTTKITFNVYKTGTSTNLTAVDYDCNINTLDLNNQTSPFTSTTDQNTLASCQFVKTGYDTNTQVIAYDTNKTLNIYLTATPSTVCGTGGTTYDFNGYRIHRFDANGTFVASKICTVNTLVIAGGGGGGAAPINQTGGGGGGAGGLTYTAAQALTAQSYTVTVGSGGAGGATGNSHPGNDGGYSSFAGVSTTGGGGGGAYQTTLNGRNGGSGGGASYTGSVGTGIAGQGNNGGLSVGDHSLWPAGGGGGAGAVGAAPVDYSTGGVGGAGLSYDINGVTVCWAGGGGGGIKATGVAGTASCGGGAGGSGATGSNGGTNTGGGGGGGGFDASTSFAGGNGANGVVIIRYLYAPTVTFNVYSATTPNNLTNINIDCNGTSYDLNNQSSPFNMDMNAGVYSCAFSKVGYDTNTIIVDTNRGTINVYLKNSSWWDMNWSYREPLTLRTTQMSLSADVTQDHVILADINSTNTNFWTNVAKPHSYGNYKIWNDLNSSLISYYKLYETGGTTATDSKGANTGTYTNSPSLNQSGYYSQAKSVSFPSANMYVDLANEANFDFERTTPFSCAGWVKLTSTAVSPIISKLDSGADYKGWECDIEAGMLTFLMIYQFTGAKTLQLRSVPTYNDGIFHYVVITYSGSNSASGVKMYVDGKQVSTTTVSDNIGANSVLNNVNATIGNRPYHTLDFNGNLSDISIFNKELSPNEILQLYNSYIGGEDIRFVNKDNNAKLNWHYEDLNFDTNRLLAWVGVTDTFSKTTDYNINMYYGNNNVTSDANSIATYPNTYILDSHLSTNGFLNQTGNSIPGTNTAITLGSGKIGNSYSYDGSSSRVTFGSGNAFLQYSSSTPFSILQWANKTDNPSSGVRSASLTSNANANKLTYGLDTNTSGVVLFTICKSSSGCNQAATTVLSNSTWYLLAGVFDTSTVKQYLNNSLTSSVSYTQGVVAASDLIADLGSYGAGSYWKGNLDETRLLNYAVSADEIKLLYNDENQNDIYLLKNNQQSQPDGNQQITFNVYGASTAHPLLTDINMQCSGTSIYDFNSQTMPKTIPMLQNSYTCSFSKTGYDTNTVSFTVSADGNVNVDLKVTNWWNMDWAYKQALTLKTSLMGLTGNVTNDHVILVDINSTNTNFWTNVNRPGPYDTNQYVWKSTGLNLDLNLVSYWKLDETTGTVVADSKGSNNGDRNVLVLFDSTGAYNGSKSAFFNNAGKINIINESNFDFLLVDNAKFTINVWTKGSGNGIYDRVFSKMDNDETRGIALMTSDPASGYIFVMQTTAAAPYNRKLWYETSGGIDDNTWHFWSISCANNDCNIFIDGVKRTPTTNHSGTYSGFSTDNNFVIGSGPTYSNPFNGRIDDFSVFNRNLSSTEVLALYNSYIGGNDIRFVNKDNNAKLNWHYEDLNFDTNRLLAWVGVTDTFPSATDLNINLYYGDSNVTSDVNSAATYPSSYIANFHLNDKSGALDYTLKNSMATATGTPSYNQAGKIGNAITLTGTQYFDVPNSGNGALNLTSQITLIAWVNQSNSQSPSYIATKSDQSVNAQYEFQLASTNQKFASKVGGTFTEFTGTGTFSNSQFQFLTTSYNGTNITDYIGDTNAGGTTLSGSMNAQTSVTFRIGTTGAAYQPFKGTLDEIKVLNYGVTQNEVRILFNDENNNAVYLIKGPQETQPSGGGSDPCAPPTNTDWNISTAITCTGNTIDIGTGALILSPGGSLKLNSSSVTANKIKLFSPGNLIYIYSGSFIKLK